MEEVKVLREGNEYYYWEWDIANATKMGEYITKKEQKFINLCLSNVDTIKPNYLILDAGAGSGRFSIPLHKKGFNVVAVDINHIPLRQLQKKENNIFLVIADVFNCPFKDDRFDSVLAIEVMNGYQLRLFLKEARRILKKRGGGLMITFSNKRSYKYYLRRIIKRREVDRKFYMLDIKDITECLNKNGFYVRKIFGFNWLPFHRASNSKLLGLFPKVEENFSLESISSLSPWVFVCAEKE